MPRIPGQLEGAQFENLAADPANLPDGRTWLNTTTHQVKSVLNGVVQIIVDHSLISNIDNTSDVNKPISTATQAALNLKANSASPAFTGSVKLISTSGGIIPPSMTTSQRDLIATPDSGTILFNTTTNTLQQYSGLAWADFGVSSLLDNSVTTAKLVDGAVTTAKLADNSATTAKIVDGSITTSKLADGQITTAKLSSGVAIPVGTPSLWLTSSAPTGWVMCGPTTIGDVSSGATGRANGDSFNLFSFLWSNFANTDLPIYDSTGATSTRGGSATSDFAAQKQLSLPNPNGLFPRFSGSQVVGGNTYAASLIAKSTDQTRSHSHDSPFYLWRNDTGSYHGIGGSAGHIADSRDGYGYGTTDRRLFVNASGGTQTAPASFGLNMIIKL